MSGGGSVDDDEIVPAVTGKARDLEQGGQLVDAGKRLSQEAGDVFLVEPRPSLRNPLEGAAADGEPPFQGARRVDLDRVQGAASTGDLARGRAQRRGERVAERRRGIGGNHKGAEAAARRPDGRRGRAGCLADAALAADEQELRPARHLLKPLSPQMKQVFPSLRL
jgi:hypothetical protein